MRGILVMMIFSFGFDAHAEKPNTSVKIPCGQNRFCPGPHYPLFTIRNSMSDDVVTVVYTKLNDQCQIEKRSGKPLFDMYIKENKGVSRGMDPLVHAALVDALHVDTNAPAEPNRFQVVVGYISKVKTRGELIGEQFEVRSEKDPNGGCLVRAIAKTNIGGKEKGMRLTHVEITSHRDGGRASGIGAFFSKDPRKAVEWARRHVVVDSVALSGTDISGKNKINPPAYQGSDPRARFRSLATVSRRPAVVSEAEIEEAEDSTLAEAMPAL